MTNDAASEAMKRIARAISSGRPTLPEVGTPDASRALFSSVLVKRLRVGEAFIYPSKGKAPGAESAGSDFVTRRARPLR